MSISYQSKDSAVQNVQLKVQELCLKLSDTAVITASASTVTVNVQEPIQEIRSVVHQKASDGSLNGLPFTSHVTSGSTSVITLDTAMAAGDSLTIKYVIDESV